MRTPFHRAVLIGAVPVLLAGGARTSPGEEDLPVSIATQDHPHVAPLMDGRVPVEGCSIRFSTLPVQDLTEKAFAESPYDVTEVELVPALERMARGHFGHYTLVPVFLGREFQHRNLYVRGDRPIQAPGDLRGKTIGVEGYGSGTAAWLRGILSSSWSVKAQEIRWVDTVSPFLQASGTAPVSRYTLPEGVSLEAAPAKRTLWDLLASGQVDAVFSSRPPRAGPKGAAPIRRLFEDYRSVEQAYFKETRVFPILTVLAVKTELVKMNAWLPEALFRAFQEARNQAAAGGTLPLPWGPEHAAEAAEVMGPHYWTYGVKNNPKSLGAILQYVHEQGIVPRAMKAEEIFEPGTILLMDE